jgi:hypothetical protein
MLVDIITAAGVVVAVATLAWQVRSSNKVATASANEAVLGALREVHAPILATPALRAYFYDGKPCPEQETDRSLVITLAELFLDVLASGLHTHRLTSDRLSEEAWTNYCRHALRNSPVMLQLVREHPDWWLNLTELAPPLPPGE